MHEIKVVALFKPDTSVKTASFYVTSLWRYCRLIVWEGCDKLEGTGGDPLQPGRGPFLPGRDPLYLGRGWGPSCPGGEGREFTPVRQGRGIACSFDSLIGCIHVGVRSLYISMNFIP